MDYKPVKTAAATDIINERANGIWWMADGHYVQYDKEDYANICQFNWKCTHIGKNRYAFALAWHKGRMVKLLFHRFVMDCPAHLVTHHINENGLDNNKDNLRNIEPRKHRNIHRIKNLRIEITWKPE